ncbi:MAG: DUF6544 family protein [Myxococcota bacterium]
MRHDKTLEQLWNEAPASTASFDANAVDRLPEAARRYIRHAFSPGAPLSECVRLHMTGSIKLDPGWCAFEAEQVIAWQRGFVWSARAKVNGLPVTGFDRLVDGEGAMRWKLLGLFNVMSADGPQLARAAAGRLHAEAIWLPSVLLRPEVTWTDIDDRRTRATIDAHGEPSELELEIDDSGALRSCSLARWGDLNSGTFAYHPFGGTADGERTFGGITIPCRNRVGWSFGTPQFERDGEFFRCTIDHAEFR